MLLAKSDMISRIDKYAEECIGISTTELMRRAGRAVANAVREKLPEGKTVVILAGKGNNGGDGYACGCELSRDYRVVVYDVFSSGQRSEAGRYFLGEMLRLGIAPLLLSKGEEAREVICRADCVIDAVFGTGFKGELPDMALWLCSRLSEATGVKIAIDVPIGINADNGSVSEYAPRMTCTVALSFMKPGLLSYPAKEYVGDLRLDTLGLDENVLSSVFEFSDYFLDAPLAASILPRREKNSHKGSFGKLLCITGSSEYRGAAYLSTEGALRGGAGIVAYMGERELCYALCAKYPEAIYKPISPISELTEEQIQDIVVTGSGYSAILIGSGCSRSEGLYRLVIALLSSEGCPVVLDADAINVVDADRERSLAALRRSKREVIITPHPLEFARISGIDVKNVQAHRIEVATAFAKEYNCTVVLKGAATLITDGKSLYINSTGSSALAKGGNGDVLAGLVGSMTACGHSPLLAAAVSVYYHGAAADVLSEQFSEYSVTPSDLPKEIGRQLAKAEAG